MRHLAVIGAPLEHSLSPLIHNAALRQLDLDDTYIYTKMKIGRHELPDVVNLVRRGSLWGINVTYPYKQDIIPYLDEMTDEARRSEAVNTVYARDGRVTGHNTDGIGGVMALNRNGVDLEDTRVTIIGAGGAARALAATLASQSLARLVIRNRTAERARDLAEHVKPFATCDVEAGGLDGLKELLQDTDILIQCSLVGMRGTDAPPLPITRDMLDAHQTVMDIVYTPLVTQLLVEARAAGCLTIVGTEMLICQGAEAFRIWTGTDAPIETMDAAVGGWIGGG